MGRKVVDILFTQRQRMISTTPDYLYWITGTLFLLTCIFALTRFTGYYIPLMTLITVAGAGILMFTAGIARSFHLVLFSLPFSINLNVTGDHLVMFPSELLVTALGISVTIYWIKNLTAFIEFLYRPLTLLLGAFLFFSLISLFTSEMIIVSTKTFILRTLYVIAFYGGGYLYFKNGGSAARYTGYYMVPLVIVAIIIIIRHSGFEFSKDVSGYITKPFYQDHTIYSAVMAFILPLAMVMTGKSAGLQRFTCFVIAGILLIAIIFAASRAAWLSIIIALVTGLLITLRIPRNVFLMLVLSLMTLLFFKGETLLWKLKANRYDSGARHAGIEEQTKSVTNISNDQSNAERINRWKCAIRMFLQKPFTGFGPGTYQFVYFPFQRESEMTRISVRSPYNIAEGRGGTAHNEFLLVLSESGIFAAVFFILTVLTVLRYGLNWCYNVPLNLWSFGMLLGFITFTTHSLFNNFLDTDKAAVLFYSAIAFFSARMVTQHKSSVT